MKHRPIRASDGRWLVPCWLVVPSDERFPMRGERCPVNGQQADTNTIKRNLRLIALGPASRSPRQDKDGHLEIPSFHSFCRRFFRLFRLRATCQVQPYSARNAVTAEPHASSCDHFVSWMHLRAGCVLLIKDPSDKMKQMSCKPR